MEDSKLTSGGEPLDADQNKRPLPNATVTLVLGIVSIPLCCCYFGVPSLASAIIALVVSSKDKSKYKANPELYSPESYRNLNAGRVCAIIGLVLTVLFLMCIFALFAFGILTELPDSPEELERAIERLENM